MSKQKFAQALHAKCGGIIILVASKEVTVVACRKCNQVWPHMSFPDLPTDMKLYNPKSHDE